MKGVLLKSKDYNLEDRAVQVSILANYFGEQLNYVEPENQKDFLTVLKIDNAAEGIEKRLKDFLKLTPGSENMKLPEDRDLEKMLDQINQENKPKDKKP
jgi:hypothetical protein